MTEEQVYDEEQAYEQVAAELAERSLKPGLWAKALADSRGDENVAKSIYLKLRATQIMQQSQQAAEIAHQEYQAAMQTAKQSAQTGQPVICQNCGHHGEVVRVARGDEGVCMLLLLLGFVPGIIYAVGAYGYRYTCAKCGTVFHEDKFG